MSEWPSEHSDYLRELCAGEPMSASQMAQAIFVRFQIGYSRVAVIGKVRRLGLQLKFSPSDNRRASKPAKIPALRAVEVEPLHVGLIELRANQCRYPFGEGPFTFCGHPRDESSFYCAAHVRLCRRPGFHAEERAA